MRTLPEAFPHLPVAAGARETWSAAPVHVGVIPDGNRRYATKTGASVEHAYLAAATKALEVVSWCLDAGVRHLSAFGVSQENIARRPHEEIIWLHEALLSFCRGVRQMPRVGLHLFGEAATLPAFVPARAELARFQRSPSTTSGARLVAHVGVNYSGQAEFAAVIRAIREHGLDAVAASPEAFILSSGLPRVDLVIRTAGEQRLSGFLPFQTAYAELWFTPTFWPELGRDEFDRALAWYARQDRRFGE
jgi:short-chain Z-isoprenyl diphosphate synthase